MNDDDTIELPLKITGVGEAASKAAQELRSNPTLDEVFSQIQSGGKSNRPPPLTEAMRKSARQQFIESKAYQKWLTENEKTQAMNLRRIVRTGRKEARDEARAEARDKLKAARDQAREEKRLNRELSNNIQSTNDRMLYQATVQANRREAAAARRSRISNAIGGGVGDMAAKGYAGAAGMVAYGFHGTLEGNAFAREFKALSREMASVFRPVVGAMTQGMAAVRGTLGELSGREQNALMYGGLALAGLSGTYGIKNTGRAAFGALSKATGGPLRAAGVIGAGIGVLSVGNDIRKMEDVRDQLRNSDRTPSTDNEVLSAGFRKGMRKDQVDAKLAEAADDVAGAKKRMNDYKDSRSGIGLFIDTLSPSWLSDAPGFGGLEREQLAIARREKVINDLKGGRTLPGKSDNGHGKVKIADTAGFGAIGSTADLIQEHLAATGGDIEQTETNKLLAAILKEVGLFNGKKPEALLNRPLGQS